MAARYDRWSDADRARLRELIAGKAKMPDMRKALGRTTGSIKAAIAKERGKAYAIRTPKPRHLTPQERYTPSYEAPARRPNSDAKHIRMVWEASGGLMFPYGVERRAA